jgi:hypothetical protein
MLIANPIYDTVFKYLMENLDIAKGIISEIIGETIEHLEFKAQEKMAKVGDTLTFYHLDFIARIKIEDGKYKTVLIELQKAHTATDIIRFRRYLGEQYKKEEEIKEKDGSVTREAIPIIAIYILGHFLSRKLPAVLKVNRHYTDVLEGKELTERIDFIECLSHDMYVIQIPALKFKMKNRLEWILSIFQQDKFINDDHHLKSYEYEVKDELMEKILKQLEKAAASQELLRQMEVEEMAMIEYEGNFGKLERKLEQERKTVIEQKQVIESKDKTIEEKDKTIEEKDKYINELLKKFGSGTPT